VTALLEEDSKRKDTSFLEDEEYFKERLVRAQKALADYQEMKRDNEKLSDGRRRWINRQIDKKRSEIKKMDQKLEEIK